MLKYWPHRSLLSSSFIKTSPVALLTLRIWHMSLPDYSLVAAILLLSFNSFQLIIQFFYCLSFHCRHHPLCLPLRCLVLYLVVFYSCSFPNIQSLFLLPNRLSVSSFTTSFPALFSSFPLTFHIVPHHHS